MGRRQMPPARANRIADAIEAIERDVTRLREIREESLAEYTAYGRQDLRDAVERKFEMLGEATVDVCPCR